MTLPPVRRRVLIVAIEPDQEPHLIEDPQEPILAVDAIELAKAEYPDARIFVLEITDTNIWLHSAERAIASLRTPESN